MAKVKIQGNASGTGTLTLTAPNTNADRTITLPDGTGELLAKDSSGNLGIGTSASVTNSLLNVNGGINSASGIIGHATNDSFTLNGKTQPHYGFNFNTAGSSPVGVSGYFGLAFATLGTERMRIDSAGRVTMPYQPAFFVKAATGNYTSTQGALPFPGVITNVGNHFNTTTNRFTAPVSGHYSFSIQFFGYSGTYSGLSPNHNGVTFGRFGREGTEGYYDGRSVSFTKYLAATDYLDVSTYYGTVHLNNNYSFFSGHLIG